MHPSPAVGFPRIRHVHAPEPGSSYQRKTILWRRSTTVSFQQPTLPAVRGWATQRDKWALDKAPIASATSGKTRVRNII